MKPTSPVARLLRPLSRRRLSGDRDRDRVPAPFVVGVGRSGTTLLRLMLDAHPELAIPPETQFVPRAISVAQERIDAGAPSSEVAEAALEVITSWPRWSDFELEAEEIRRRMAERGQLSAGDTIRCFFEAYAAGQDKPRWGDKSPSYTWKLLRIQKALGEARFVHIIRDGRDVAVSLRDVSWGPDDIAGAASKWVSEITRARRRSRRLAPGTYIEVRFEQLVADPEPVLREVAGAIELPWDSAMLDYHQGARERMRHEMSNRIDFREGGTLLPEDRAAQHAFIDSPPSSDRVGRWRNEMSAEEREVFEGIAGALLDDLGYER